VGTKGESGEASGARLEKDGDSERRRRGCGPGEAGRIAATGRCAKGGTIKERNAVYAEIDDAVRTVGTKDTRQAH